MFRDEAVPYGDHAITSELIYNLEEGPFVLATQVIGQTGLTACLLRSFFWFLPRQ